MKRTTRLARALAVVAAAGVLAACGGGSSGGGGDKDEAGSGEASGEASGGASAGKDGAEDDGDGGSDAPPVPQLPVPALYDTATGWTSPLQGTHLVLPSAEAVAVFTDGTASPSFTVLNAADGALRWRSAPVEPVAPDATLHAFAATVGGADYLVAWSAGEAGGDVVNRGEETIAIDVFAADASGEQVAPTRRVEVSGSGEVAAGGAALMVRLDDGTVVAVDPATGERTPYEPEGFAAPPDCADCEERGAEIVAITPAGPLLRYHAEYPGFWVPDAWSSGGIAPADAEAEDVAVDLVADDLLVAQWATKDDSGQVLWTVLDAGTGEILATTDVCAEGGEDPDFGGVSSDGRYLAHGTRVFDLREGTGRCFAGSETTNTVTFEALSPQGAAFGRASSEDSWGSNVPVQLDIATGEAQELPADVLFPFGDTGGAGLFWDEDTETLVVYPHAG